MKKLLTIFKKNDVVQDESGATAIEYGLLASLIALAIIVAVTTLGTKLKTVFTNVNAGITTTN